MGGSKLVGMVRAGLPLRGCEAAHRVGTVGRGRLRGFFSALSVPWLVGLGACTGDPASDPAVQGKPGAAPGAEVQTSLVQTITTRDSVVLYRLGDIIVSEDGSMVAVNGGTPSLLWVDASGRVKWERGRAGQGPGEFASITNLRRVSNQAVAWDQRLRHLTFYSLDGTYLRTVGVDVQGAWRFIGGTWPRELFFVKAPQGADVSRRWVSVDSTGVVTRHWARIGHPRPVIGYPSRHPLTGEMGTTVLHLPDCLPETFEFVVGGELFEVDTGGGTMIALGARDESGRLLFRSPWRVPFDRGASDRIRRSISGAPPDTLRSMLRRAGAPDGFIPAWKEALATPDGLVFLQRASCARAEHRLWDVVSTTGQHLGTFSLPIEAALKGASRDWLAIVSSDSLGVEQIELLRWDTVEGNGASSAPSGRAQGK